MASINAACVRAAARRTTCLSLATASSTGDTSGDYAGRYHRAHPAASPNAPTRGWWWARRLSRTTLCPARSAGTRMCHIPPNRGSVRGARHHHGRSHTLRRQRRTQRRIGGARHLPNCALSFRRTCIAWRQVKVTAILVDDDTVVSVLRAYPRSPRLPLLLVACGGCPCRCCRVQPTRASTRPSVRALSAVPWAVFQAVPARPAWRPRAPPIASTTRRAVLAQSCEAGPVRRSAHQ